MAEPLNTALQLPFIERKALPLAMTPDSIDEQGIFEGYASVNGNVDSEGDIVMPGAFRATLADGMAKDGVPILLLHNDQRLPVGRSLTLEEDSRGLHIRAQLADTTDGLDARKLVRSGILRGLSIGYIPTRAETGADGVRRLYEVELLEISLVTWPANALATVTGYKSAKGGAEMQEPGNKPAQPEGREEAGKPKEAEKPGKAAQIDLEGLSKEDALELIERLRSKYGLDDDEPIEIIDDEEEKE